jgi:6,7-dimethyl-8-ribityllumazine synthase
MARSPARDATLDGHEFRLAIAVARYHAQLSQSMLEDAQARARELGAQVVAILEVSGAYDLPLAVHSLLRRPDVDAAVALGSIITGETEHDEVIGHACVQALTRLSIDHEKPVGLGVTGPGQTMDQARARVDRAGYAVDAVIRLLRSLGKAPPGKARIPTGPAPS